MVSLSKIAEKAGVSTATVSRVLNNHPYVTEEKKHLVLTAIKELNYIPNQHAQSLRLGKSKTIGLNVSSINHPFFSKLMDGVFQTINKHGYSLLINQSFDNERSELDFLNKTRSNIVDGIVMGSTILRTEEILSVCSNKPIVLCASDSQNLISNVHVNHARGIELAYEHLVDNGYKKIGIAIGNEDSFIETERLESFFNCIQKYNHPFKSEWLKSGNYTLEDGMNVFIDWASKSSKPEALIVGNDLVACGIYISATKKSVNIPEDLAIIGFDNHPLSEILGITTVSQPIEKIGGSAVELLLNKVSSRRNIYSKEELPIHLIKRGSTFKYIK